MRQSWVIALADQAIYEAGVMHEVPVSWQPLLGGLRLWLLWQADGPLTESRKNIIRWRFGNEDTSFPMEGPPHICQTFAIWRLSPLNYSLPLACGPADSSNLRLSSAPTTLIELGLPEAVWGIEDDQTQLFGSHNSNAGPVALALLIEYAVERYGEETLPVLLTTLDKHNSWETLIPAVYEVETGEFEAGWRESIAYFIRWRSHSIACKPGQ